METLTKLLECIDTNANALIDRINNLTKIDDNTINRIIIDKASRVKLRSEYENLFKSIEVQNILEQFKLCKNEMDTLMKSTLKRFLNKHDLDLNLYDRYSNKEYYLTAIFNYYIFLNIWLREINDVQLLEKSRLIFEASIYGTLGYRILDFHIDENKSNKSELLLSHELISLQEQTLLEIFGFNEKNYKIINEYKVKFLTQEIFEQMKRNIISPYSLDYPSDCGNRAVHLFAPIALILQKNQLDNTYNKIYFEIFKFCFACMQIIDDISDINEDVENGYFSIATVGKENIYKQMSKGERLNYLLNDKATMLMLFNYCSDMINNAIYISKNPQCSSIYKVAIQFTRLNVNYFFSKTILN